MTKNNIWPVLILTIPIVVILLIAITIFNKKIQTSPGDKPNEADEANAEKIEIVSDNNPAADVYYAEGDENSDYNYIVDMHKVNQAYPEIPYTFYQEAGDQVDNFMRQSGYVAQPLYVKTAHRKSEKVEIIFQTEDNAEILNLVYSPMTENWSFTLL